MTDQLPPVLSYQTPTPTTPNFGTRIAKASWLAPLAAAPLFLMMLRRLTLGGPNSGNGFEFSGSILLVIGVVSSVVALVSMLRYGRKGILRPALAGLCLSLAMAPFVVLLFFWMSAGSSSSSQVPSGDQSQVQQQVAASMAATPAKTLDQDPVGNFKVFSGRYLEAVKRELNAAHLTDDVTANWTMSYGVSQTRSVSSTGSLVGPLVAKLTISHDKRLHNIDGHAIYLLTQYKLAFPAQEGRWAFRPPEAAQVYVQDPSPVSPGDASVGFGLDDAELKLTQQAFAKAYESTPQP